MAVAMICEARHMLAHGLAARNCISHARRHCALCCQFFTQRHTRACLRSLNIRCARAQVHKLNPNPESETHLQTTLTSWPQLNLTTGAQIHVAWRTTRESELQVQAGTTGGGSALWRYHPRCRAGTLRPCTRHVWEVCLKQGVRT